LLSSQIANRRKVELLIAIKDQARELHKPKADVLEKSKLKNRQSVRRSSLLCLQLKPAFFCWLQQRQFKRNKHLHLPTFVARVIIKQK